MALSTLGGGNSSGQLGFGYYKNCNTPEVVIALQNVVKISAGGDHTLVLTQSGTFYAWGHNLYGQLSLGHYNDRSIPQVISALKNVVKISARDHTLAVTQDGALYAWGFNRYGQLGLGHNNNHNTPQVVTALKNVVNITAGTSHTLVLTQDGKLYAWGSNCNGRLGLGSDIEELNKPKQIPLYNNLTKIIESITRREHKKQLRNTVAPSKTKQALLTQLDAFLPSNSALNSFSLKISSKFFEPKREIKLAQSLRDFIDLKNSSIELIENEIDMYKILNRQNNGLAKDTFEKCLDELIKILDEVKKALLKPIENELNTMIKRF